MLALDIGTTKICALITTVNKNTGDLEILGIGKSVSDGLNRGVITNINKTAKAISSAINKAEQQSGQKATSAICGIAGDHVQTVTSHHIISIPSHIGEVSVKDVERLIDEASKMPISSDQKIIHLFPQEYIVDGQDKVDDPIGMSGVRLEAHINIITGLSSAIDNISKCVTRANEEVKVKEIILEPFASSYSVLSEDEKNVGVALVDIGGGTTDIAIFKDGVIKYINVIAVGGNLLTDDLREVLQIVRNEAEILKKDFGHCYLKKMRDDILLQVPGVNGRKPKEIQKSLLTKILEARMREILEFVDNSLVLSGFKDKLGAGVVFTGGSTLLQGIDYLAEEVLKCSVKIGIPSGISSSGLAPEVANPIFATSVGLALHGFKNELGKELIIPKEKKKDEDIDEGEESPDEIDYSHGDVNNKKVKKSKEEKVKGESTWSLLIG